MALELIFNGDYAEQLMLPSGESLRFRLVRPTDKAHMCRGFAGLSSASRKKRFLAAKDSLSEAELHYFTELDQFDHFAIGAMCLSAEGEENEVVGVTRFVRFPSDPKSAEVAIAVVDRLQGKGIGTFLLQRLIAAATERGVERLRFDCLSDNLEMRRLFSRVCHSAAMFNEDGVVVAEANLVDGFITSNLGPRDAAA